MALFFREKKQQREENARTLEKHSERLTLEKIREKSVKVVEVIEKRHRKMRKEIATITLIAETGIAVHAAPLILASLAEKLPPPIRAVEKSMRRHEKRELRMKNKEFRKSAKRETKKDSVKIQPLRSERAEPFRVTKERKRKKVRTEVKKEVKAGNRKERRRRVKQDEKIGGKRVAAAEKLTPIRMEKLKNPEGRRFRKLRRVMKRVERIAETKQIPKKEKKLWMALVVAATEYVFEKKRGEQKKEPVWEQKERKRSIKKRERVAVAGVNFAWMVWVMLHRADLPPTGSKLAMVVQERRGAKLVHPSGEQYWVLLSIIWYLTAIREQGMGNYPMKKKRKKLPKKGIIFCIRS